MDVVGLTRRACASDGRAGRPWGAPSIELDDDLVGSQQKQSPEEGIPEGGPIPLHRDTTILIHLSLSLSIISISMYLYIYISIYLYVYICMYIYIGFIRPAWPTCRLAFTRYCFISSRLCTSPSSFHSSSPPALRTLMQYCCTAIGQYTTPPYLPLVCHTPCNIGDCNIV